MIRRVFLALAAVGLLGLAVAGSVNAADLNSNPSESVAVAQASPTGTPGVADTGNFGFQEAGGMPLALAAGLVVLVVGVVGGARYAIGQKSNF